MKRGVSRSTSATLSVGEVAARAGVAVSTLHFYEAKGLLWSVRNSGNQRRYGRGVLRTIAIIRVAQRAGIPLATIAQRLSMMPKGEPPSVADWERLSTGWHADLDDRIARLTRLRDQMLSCIGCGCLSITLCPLRNPDDVLAETGAGPRLLDP